MTLVYQLLAVAGLLIMAWSSGRRFERAKWKEQVAFEQALRAASIVEADRRVREVLQRGEQIRKDAHAAVVRGDIRGALATLGVRGPTPKPPDSTVPAPRVPEG